jgi:hypothetical protein
MALTSTGYLPTTAGTSGSANWYTSANSTGNAVTTIIVCNVNAYNPSTPTANTANFSLYAVPSGSTPGLTNLIVNQLPITAGETLSLDQEKIVLASGDSLVAISSVVSTLVMTISTLAV